jgi:hypothetical protein
MRPAVNGRSRTSRTAASQYMSQLAGRLLHFPTAMNRRSDSHWIERYVISRPTALLRGNDRAQDFIQDGCRNGRSGMALQQSR